MSLRSVHLRANHKSSFIDRAFHAVLMALNNEGFVVECRSAVRARKMISGLG